MSEETDAEAEAGDGWLAKYKKRTEGPLAGVFSLLELQAAFLSASQLSAGTPHPPLFCPQSIVACDYQDGPQTFHASILFNGWKGEEVGEGWASFKDIQQVYDLIVRLTKEKGDTSRLVAGTFYFNVNGFSKTRDDFLADCGVAIVYPGNTMPDGKSNLPRSDDERILTGDRPASLRPQIYKKRNTPPSPEAVKEANQILNQKRTRQKEGYQFNEAELEIVRAAGRVKSAYDKHSKLAKQGQRRRLQSQALTVK